MCLSKTLNAAIVKGQVASYAISVAVNNHVKHGELAVVLREIADELEHKCPKN